MIPNVRWGDERTYSFCFEGIEKGGTVAVSSHGCLRGEENREYFQTGFLRMVSRLRPKRIINYSNTPKELLNVCKEAGIETIVIENEWKALGKKAEA